MFIFVVFFALWLIGFVFAYRDNFLTVEQMQGHGVGFEKGIPLVGHMGCLVLDLLPFPLLMTYWTSTVSNSWEFLDIILMCLLGLIVSAFLHVSYIKGGRIFPEFVTYGGDLTAAGWTHVVYMGVGFGMIGLIYFCTKHPNPYMLWLTTVYLISHVIVGVHVIHKIWAPEWFPYDTIWDAGTLRPILGTTVILLGLTWWALH